MIELVKQQKEFLVSFDMKNSHEFRVKARTIGEAKAKAFDRFEKIRNKRSAFNIEADVI